MIPPIYVGENDSSTRCSMSFVGRDRLGPTSDVQLHQKASPQTNTWECQMPNTHRRRNIKRDREEVCTVYFYGFKAHRISRMSLYTVPYWYSKAKEKEKRKESRWKLSLTRFPRRFCPATLFDFNFLLGRTAARCPRGVSVPETPLLVSCSA